MGVWHNLLDEKSENYCNSTDLSPFIPLLYSGLYPDDHIEAAFADAAVNAVGDNHMRLAPTVLEKDKANQVWFPSTVSICHVLL